MTQPKFDKPLFQFSVSDLVERYSKSVISEQNRIQFFVKEIVLGYFLHPTSSNSIQISTQETWLKEYSFGLLSLAKIPNTILTNQIVLAILAVLHRSQNMIGREELFDKCAQSLLLFLKTMGESRDPWFDTLDLTTKTSLLDIIAIINSKNFVTHTKVNYPYVSTVILYILRSVLRVNKSTSLTDDRINALETSLSNSLTSKHHLHQIQSLLENLTNSSLYPTGAGIKFSQSEQSDCSNVKDMIWGAFKIVGGITLLAATLAVEVAAPGISTVALCLAVATFGYDVIFETGSDGVSFGSQFKKWIRKSSEKEAKFGLWLSRCYDDITVFVEFQKKRNLHTGWFRGIDKISTKVFFFGLAISIWGTASKNTPKIEATLAFVNFCTNQINFLLKHKKVEFTQVFCYIFPFLFHAAIHTHDPNFTSLLNTLILEAISLTQSDSDGSFALWSCLSLEQRDIMTNLSQEEFSPPMIQEWLKLQNQTTNPSDSSSKVLKAKFHPQARSFINHFCNKQLLSSENSQLNWKSTQNFQKQDEFLLHTIQNIYFNPNCPFFPLYSRPLPPKPYCDLISLSPKNSRLLDFDMYQSTKQSTMEPKLTLKILTGNTRGKEFQVHHLLRGQNTIPFYWFLDSSFQSLKRIFTHFFPWENDYSDVGRLFELFSCLGKIALIFTNMDSFPSLLFPIQLFETLNTNFKLKHDIMVIFLPESSQISSQPSYTLDSLTFSIDSDSKSNNEYFSSNLFEAIRSLVEYYSPTIASKFENIYKSDIDAFCREFLAHFPNQSPPGELSSKFSLYNLTPLHSFATKIISIYSKNQGIGENLQNLSLLLHDTTSKLTFRTIQELYTQYYRNILQSQDRIHNAAVCIILIYDSVLARSNLKLLLKMYFNFFSYLPDDSDIDFAIDSLPLDIISQTEIGITSNIPTPLVPISTNSTDAKLSDLTTVTGKVYFMHHSFREYLLNQFRYPHHEFIRLFGALPSYPLILLRQFHEIFHYSYPDIASRDTCHRLAPYISILLKFLSKHRFKLPQLFDSSDIDALVSTVHQYLDYATDTLVNSVQSLETLLWALHHLVPRIQSWQKEFWTVEFKFTLLFMFRFAQSHKMQIWPQNLEKRVQDLGLVLKSHSPGSSSSSVLSLFKLGISIYKKCIDFHPEFHNWSLLIHLIKMIPLLGENSAIKLIRTIIGTFHSVKPVEFQPLVYRQLALTYHQLRNPRECLSWYYSALDRLNSLSDSIKKSKSKPFISETRFNYIQLLVLHFHPIFKLYAGEFGSSDFATIEFLASKRQDIIFTKHPYPFSDLLTVNIQYSRCYLYHGQPAKAFEYICMGLDYTPHFIRSELYLPLIVQYLCTLQQGNRALVSFQKYFGAPLDQYSQNHHYIHYPQFVFALIRWYEYTGDWSSSFQVLSEFSNLQTTEYLFFDHLSFQPPSEKRGYNTTIFDCSGYFDLSSWKILSTLDYDVFSSSIDVKDYFCKRLGLIDIVVPGNAPSFLRAEHFYLDASFQKYVFRERLTRFFSFISNPYSLEEQKLKSSIFENFIFALGDFFSNVFNIGYDNSSSENIKEFLNDIISEISYFSLFPYFLGKLFAHLPDKNQLKSVFLQFLSSLPSTPKSFQNDVIRHSADSNFDLSCIQRFFSGIFSLDSLCQLFTFLIKQSSDENQNPAISSVNMAKTNIHLLIEVIRKQLVPEKVLSEFYLRITNWLHTVVGSQIQINEFPSHIIVEIQQNLMKRCFQEIESFELSNQEKILFKRQITLCTFQSINEHPSYFDNLFSSPGLQNQDILFGKLLDDQGNPDAKKFISMYWTPKFPVSSKEVSNIQCFEDALLKYFTNFERFLSNDIHQIPLFWRFETVIPQILKSIQPSNIADPLKAFVSLCLFFWGKLPVDIASPTSIRFCSVKLFSITRLLQVVGKDSFSNAKEILCHLSPKSSSGMFEQLYQGARKLNSQSLHLQRCNSILLQLHKPFDSIHFD